MKEGFFYLSILCSLMACSSDATDSEPQTDNTDNDNEILVANAVAIPDVNFEQALIDKNLDDTLDGQVLKENIDFISELELTDLGISDLTGIAAFEQLKNLNVRGNALKSLDVRRNSELLFVWAEDNELESLNVNGLSRIEKIGADRNALSQIDIETNVALQFLTLSDNVLTDIDVSNNSALTDFNIMGNPVRCILVNQAQFESVPTDWNKDEDDDYALDCQ